jgi:Methyltransferase domain
MTHPIQKLFSIFIPRALPPETDEVEARGDEKHEIVFASAIRSNEEYETAYGKLAVAIGQRERTPQPEEWQRIRQLLNKRKNPAGSLGPADCFFLAAFVSIARPRRMIEIGTGSGFSGALVASVMHLREPNLHAPWLDTFDVQTKYFGDATLPVGFEIPDLISEHAELVRVHAPGESSLVGTLAHKNELELAFIDGNHQHPCVLLDLLRIAPYLRTGSWVLLHDIRLGTLVEQSRSTAAPLPFEAVYGAEWLFNDWPWSKIDGGNIGAIQLPQQKKALQPFARTLMKRPLEVCEQSYQRMHREVNEARRGLCR